MPKSVGLAVVGVGAQALLYLAAGALLLSVVCDAVDHGRDEGTGPLRFLAVLSVLVAVTLVLCGAWSGKRSPGVRVTVVFIEGLSLPAGVLGLLRGGGVSVLSGIVFAVAALRIFSSAEAENWLDR